MDSTPGSAVSPETLSQIAEAVSGIRFGCVQITIRDARVVEIETTHKMRIDPQPSAGRSA